MSGHRNKGEPTTILEGVQIVQGFSQLVIASLNAGRELLPRVSSPRRRGVAGCVTIHVVVARARVIVLVALVLLAVVGALPEEEAQGGEAGRRRLHLEEPVEERPHLARPRGEEEEAVGGVGVPHPERARARAHRRLLRRRPLDRQAARPPALSARGRRDGRGDHAREWRGMGEGWERDGRGMGEGWERDGRGMGAQLGRDAPCSGAKQREDLLAYLHHARPPSPPSHPGVGGGEVHGEAERARPPSPSSSPSPSSPSSPSSTRALLHLLPCKMILWRQFLLAHYLNVPFCRTKSN
jgi:hypothetical protein